jgi:hypothetical protein
VGACGATLGLISGNRRLTACEIRATAALRLVNFLTGFKSSNGTTPAKPFQSSTSLAAGQEAVSLASSLGVENTLAGLLLAGASAKA